MFQPNELKQHRSQLNVNKSSSDDWPMMMRLDGADQTDVDDDWDWDWRL